MSRDNADRDALSWEAWAQTLTGSDSDDSGVLRRAIAEMVAQTMVTVHWPHAGPHAGPRPYTGPTKVGDRVKPRDVPYPGTVIRDGDGDLALRLSADHGQWVQWYDEPNVPPRGDRWPWFDGDSHWVTDDQGCVEIVALGVDVSGNTQQRCDAARTAATMTAATRVEDEPAWRSVPVGTVLRETFGNGESWLIVRTSATSYAPITKRDKDGVPRRLHRTLGQTDLDWSNVGKVGTPEPIKVEALGAGAAVDLTTRDAARWAVDALNIANVGWRGVPVGAVVQQKSGSFYLRISAAQGRTIKHSRYGSSLPVFAWENWSVCRGNDVIDRIVAVGVDLSGDATEQAATAIAAVRRQSPDLHDEGT